jgi:hypothetical protein
MRLDNEELTLSLKAAFAPDNCLVTPCCPTIAAMAVDWNFVENARFNGSDAVAEVAVPFLA